MADHQLHAVIGRLRRVVMSQMNLRSPPDAELLEAFLHHRDEAAVEMLIWRHGSMVLNLCRRILHDEHRAEDAFQAVFLVFIRKAASIGRRQSVGSWLYRVAFRIAIKLRDRLAKQPERRAETVDLDKLPGGEQADNLIWCDLRSVLDEEISLLPEKHRSPIVLCYLQGHTIEEASELLGCPERTIQFHLSRGRDRLKARLTKRGLALSAGWLATHLSAKAASAEVPTALVACTIKAAGEIAAGKTATGLVSTSVISLANGALRSLVAAKIKHAALIIFAVVALATGIGWVVHWVLANPHHHRKAGRELALEESFRQQRLSPRHLPSLAGATVGQPQAPPKHFTNHLGMRFVRIPPGTFIMGSPNEEKQRRPDEAQHKVTLSKGFYMGVYAVTQEQWHDVMGNNPSFFKGEKNLPVDSVSWEECQHFIAKLREKDKRPYRLPTEAEWEYACRAGSTTAFHFGETISTDLACYLGTSVYGNGAKGLDRRKTVPVGSFPANAWGLHDMHGNVRQWCQDWFDDYPAGDVVDPQGQNADGTRVARGGSWGDPASMLRSACRNRDGPARHSDAFGFRLCFTPE